MWLRCTIFIYPVVCYRQNLDNPYMVSICRLFCGMLLTAVNLFTWQYVLEIDCFVFFSALTLFFLHFYFLFEISRLYSFIYIKLSKFTKLKIFIIRGSFQTKGKENSKSTSSWQQGSLLPRSQTDLESSEPCVGRCKSTTPILLETLILSSFFSSAAEFYQCLPAFRYPQKHLCDHWAGILSDVQSTPRLRQPSAIHHSDSAVDLVIL